MTQTKEHHSPLSHANISGHWTIGRLELSFNKYDDDTYKFHAYYSGSICTGVDYLWLKKNSHDRMYAVVRGIDPWDDTMKLFESESYSEALTYLSLME